MRSDPAAAAVIADITGRVEYLRVSVGADGPGWFRCGHLVSDADHLGGVVGGTKTGRGTDREDIAMSLFVQGYAFRIASILIGGWLIADQVLDLSPPNTAISIDRNRPNGVAVDAAQFSVDAGDTLFALHSALNDHLGEVVVTAHKACRIGEPLLWGNVAASYASSFGAFVDVVQGGPAANRDAATRFFTAAPEPIAHAGRLVPVGSRWAWERKSCCLWYQTESGFKCADCSLWTDEDRQERYAAAIAAEGTA